MYCTDSFSFVHRRLYRAGVCILIAPTLSSVSLEAMSHPSHLRPHVSRTALTLVRCEPECVIIKQRILSELAVSRSDDETMILSMTGRLESKSESQQSGGLRDSTISFRWSISVEGSRLESKRTTVIIDRHHRAASPIIPRYQPAYNLGIASVSS